MIITWFGHSCFKVESDNISIVFDPYCPGYVPGIKMPQLSANYCICSHGHEDHNYSKGVDIIKSSTQINIKQINTYHDHNKGLKRGKNICTVIEFPNGKRVAHLGDLGHKLSTEQLKEIGRLDILFIPVGGYYTVDGNEAAEIAKDINAAITIPMHYKGNGFGFDIISTVEKFAENFTSVKYLDSNIFDTNASKFNGIIIPKCPTI